MSDEISPEFSRVEIGKDAVESTLDAAAQTVGTVTNIVVGAVRDVAKALGDFGTEVFEIRDAAKRATEDD